MDGIREGNIYLLRAKPVALIALSNRDSLVTAETGHRRLDHRNFDGAAQAKIKKGVIGLDIKDSVGYDRLVEVGRLP